MKEPSWHELPTELWERVIRYLHDPKEWVSLSATTSWLRTLTLQYGFQKVTSLEITASARAHGSRCEILVKRGKQQSCTELGIYQTRAAIEYFWKNSERIIEVVLKSPEIKHVASPLLQMRTGFREIPQNLQPCFMRVLQTILTCNTHDYRAVQKFTYAPIFMPPSLSWHNQYMTYCVETLLKSWKPTLTSLTMLDQGEHVRGWVDILRGQNHLHTLRVRTTHFQQCVPSLSEEEVFRPRNLQLGDLATITNGVRSKVNKLAIYVNGNRCQLHDQEMLQIVTFLRGLQPHEYYEVTFPNNVISPHDVFVALIGATQLLRISPWQRGIKTLNLGVQANMSLNLWPLFPNLRECFGMTFRQEHLLQAGFLRHLNYTNPRFGSRLTFKCQPTYREDKVFHDAMQTLRYYPMGHPLQELCYAIGVIGVIFHVTRQGCQPEIVTIVVRPEEQDLPELTFLIPLYSEDRIRNSDHRTLLYQLDC
jgi:hypothetical protein